MPPPAVASTLIWAISCWSFSCICCAWRIICCMLPGSFTLRLLEIANLIDFAVEDFLETLHLGIGQGTFGDLVFGVGYRRGERSGGLLNFSHDHLYAHRPGRHLVYCLTEIVFAQRQFERLGSGDQQFPVLLRYIGVLDCICRER